MLGMSDRGRIEKGMVADLVVLDADLQPRTTIVGGQVVFQAS
jgi:N-acetylglucosamine-6-phosphate deacetylase